MKNLIVEIPSMAKPIQPSPGFVKKGLSNFKLDLLGKCGFSCTYCSTKNGNSLRIPRKKYLAMAKEQLGYPVTMDTPGLTLVWPEVLANLKNQLNAHSWDWGQGQTLVFSMLTDAFSPYLERNGVTREALELLVRHSSFRIRVLTKSAKVGTDEWISFFQKYPKRFVVGLSIGTLDDEWAKSVEQGTSIPSARIRALHRLQDAGVPTFGMLCPVFPDVLDSGGVANLLHEIRPVICEHIWAEPFNDRQNWKQVRAGYSEGSTGYKRLTEMFSNRKAGIWSKYAVDLLLQFRSQARNDGWMDKLRYLLYEDRITPDDVYRMENLDGVLLQSKPDSKGFSKNSGIRKLQLG